LRRMLQLVSGRDVNGIDAGAGVPFVERVSSCVVAGGFSLLGAA